MVEEAEVERAECGARVDRLGAEGGGDDEEVERAAGHEVVLRLLTYHMARRRWNIRGRKREAGSGKRESKVPLDGNLSWPPR